MRIISGKSRGTKLYTLEGINTRPTLDRVKEPLFSIIQTRIQQSIVLDLFAGSGALGIESLSRGAKFAYLCDSSKQAIKIIKQNVEKTRFINQSKIINDDYKNVLEKLEKENIKFDLIFLDPPYETNYIKDALEKIDQFNLLNEDGIIIAETDQLNKLTDIKFNIYDTRRYGKVMLVFLNRKE